MRAFCYSRIVKKMKRQFGSWPVPPKHRDQLLANHFFPGQDPVADIASSARGAPKFNLTTMAESFSSPLFRSEALDYLTSEAFVSDYKDSLSQKMERFLERLGAKVGRADLSSITVPALRGFLRRTPFPWTLGEVQAARSHMIRLISDECQLYA